MNESEPHPPKAGNNKPKLAATDFLDRFAIPYELLEFQVETERGAAAVAHELNIPEQQAVKTLIFQTDSVERAMVMVGGDQSAISGNLKKAIGSRNIRMASPEVVLETTGYAIGLIPPFSWQTAGFRSFLDVSLLAEKRAGVGAGVWGHVIIMTPENLILASKAMVVNITDRERMVF